jgi:hypothetical protein
MNLADAIVNESSQSPSRFARPLNLSPEVASMLSIRRDASSGVIAIEGSAVRWAGSSSKRKPLVVLASNRAQTTTQPRKSFETDVTFVEPARRPSNSTSDSDRGRRYAKPLHVSDDVNAILQGRMRGGGLSMGGEPMRATAKGDRSARITTPSSSAPSTTTRNTNKNSLLHKLFSSKQKSI